MTERPDLFAAVVPVVGALDMVRMETTANGVPNVPEFGTVAKEDEFRALLAMSSYHQVKDGTAYPAVMLMHGVNDPRVDVLAFGEDGRAARRRHDLGQTGPAQPRLRSRPRRRRYEGAAPARERRLLCLPLLADRTGRFPAALKARRNQCSSGDLVLVPDCLTLYSRAQREPDFWRRTHKPVLSKVCSARAAIWSATRLRAAVARMLEKADEALAALTMQTQSKDAQQAYQQTRKVLVSGRQTLEAQFHQLYLAEFLKRTSQVTDDAQSFAEFNTSLELVGEDDLEETLTFKELATKLRRYCDEELGALDQRVGVLLGDANLAAERNPFGPETICDAYQQACHALKAETQVRGVLRKLFDDHVIDEVRSVYKDVNALLVRNSILPKIRYNLSRKPEEARKATGKAGDAHEGGVADEQSIFSLLQNLVAGQGAAGGRGGGAGGLALPPGVVILQGAELLGSLTRLQQGDTSVIPGGLPAAAAAGSGTVNVLNELKSTSFAAGLVQMDATTLDIVAMLFDQLFDDPKIPVGLKSLIGRLQIPMLKVAIADKSFFTNKTHPARALLDTFGDLAARLPTEFGTQHPTFVRIEALVQQIVDTFQEDVGVFEGARAQLEALIAEHDEHIQAESQAAAKRIEQTENLAVAKTAAEDEVKARLQSHNVPGTVLEFIVEQWRRLLLLVHAKYGRNGAEWKDAIETMDELIWSVEPKTSVEDRRKLAAMVPRLIKRLGKGMQALGTPADVRQRFLGELMRIHTEPLAKANEKPAPDKTPAAAQPASAAPASLDLSAPVTVKNPYGAGEVQVSGLDFAPMPADLDKRAAAKAVLQASLAAEPPEKMTMGTWVEFRPKDNGEQRVAKLLFVSPKKTRYLFSDRRGEDVLELSRAEIVRRLRTGEVVRLENEPHAALRSHHERRRRQAAHTGDPRGLSGFRARRGRKPRAFHLCAWRRRPQERPCHARHRRGPRCPRRRSAPLQLSLSRARRKAARSDAGAARALRRRGPTPQAGTCTAGRSSSAAARWAAASPPCSPPTALPATRSCYLPIRCTRRGSRRSCATRICRASACRCCASTATATRSAPKSSWSGHSSRSARTGASTGSKAPTIR